MHMCESSRLADALQSTYLCNYVCVYVCACTGTYVPAIEKHSAGLTRSTREKFKNRSTFYSCAGKWAARRILLFRTDEDRYRDRGSETRLEVSRIDSRNISIERIFSIILFRIFFSATRRNFERKVGIFFRRI